MSLNFPNAEEKVLEYWREIDAFHTQLRLTENGPHFPFYDGPPFATGLPHYGHLLTSTIKDIISRYWSMKGHHVVRRFGWDTHGVPIEFKVDEKLKISGRDAVMKFGIEKYNSECRAIVMQNSAEWRQTIERLGRWIDFDDDYKSMDTSFMESCWWVFKQLFDKGDVYRNYQIMPYSVKLCTPLSQMESNLVVRDTQDPAVLVSFPLKGVGGKENTHLVIYTTTPWTLPSNLLIAVHPDLEYVEVLDEGSNRGYILLESSLPMLYKDSDQTKYRIIAKIQGKAMLGWKYEPLFPYFADAFSDCFQVILADFVSAQEGTGLVHQAPAFGQEDYNAALAAGFISPHRLPPCPVDEKGCFTPEVPDYVGQMVKDADKAILNDLWPTGRLLFEGQITHSDKFCWRSDSQLIRRAVSSWFIRVKDSVPQMLENLNATTWVPEWVKEKRFRQWVEDAHDWNVSRNRYWGTPIPLWVSEDYEEVVCVGSIEELRRLSGFEGPLDDIHRDKVDGITIPSKRGKGVLRRVEEIFDCWFESGSMPYASNHFPFENADTFHDQRFPAGFIAEGRDQTRGWFYTLTVLGNKLFGKSPFRNVIVNGIVLDKYGKKMSKSMGNFPDPNGILDTYGSDALRLYLIDSPAVRGEDTKFNEPGIKDMVSRFLLPFWNSYRFFHEQTLLYKESTGRDFVLDSVFGQQPPSNVMDQWILAHCQSFLRFVDQELQAHRLNTVVPQLLQVVNNLSNWYIRFNRVRLKGAADLGVQDTTEALSTLLHVLFTLVRAFAPFTPFIAEHIYQLLKPHLTEVTASLQDPRSVHFLPLPVAQEVLSDATIERQLSAMQQVIQLGRVARERSKVTLKTPLLSMVVVADKQLLADLEQLKSYIQSELNVRDVVLTDDKDRYHIVLEAEINWPGLGKKVKGGIQLVQKALPALTQAQLRQYQREKKLTLNGIELEEGDVTLKWTIDKSFARDATSFSSPSSVTTSSSNTTNTIKTTDPNTETKTTAPQWQPAFSPTPSLDLAVLLDTTPHPSLVSEALAREIIHHFQRLRKKAGLMLTDTVRMGYQVISNPHLGLDAGSGSGSDEWGNGSDINGGVDIKKVVEEEQRMFEGALRGRVEETTGGEVKGEVEDKNEEGFVLAEEQVVLGGVVLRLRISRVPPC